MKHPGFEIRDQYLDERGMNPAELARQTGVSKSFVSRLLNGKAGISAAMAIKLATVLGLTAEDWMKKQADFDLMIARKGMERLDKEVQDGY